MKAQDTHLLTFIQNAPQFVIPIYQRNYSWTRQQCAQLWNDIVRAGKNPDSPGHFIGSIVYVADRESVMSNRSPLLVIDGQQRLTTITLLLAALTEFLGDDESVDDFSKEKVLYYYLLNHLEKGERRYRLLLSQTDKPTLLHILGGPAPQSSSLTITENYEFFREQLAACTDIDAVCRGLAKLLVVEVALTRGHDNPQLIFESMNSTGLALSQADLIRNFLLMGQNTDSQIYLYEHYWRPMELAFGQAAYQEHFDGFMRHYLTTKTGNIPRFDQIYSAFKVYAQHENLINGQIEALLKELLAYARYYCNMALGAEQDTELAQAFHDLRELRADVAYPLLLEWYHDYANDVWRKEDFLESVRLLESYIFRRAACSIPTNSLNKTFTTFSKGMCKTNYLESVKAKFAGLASYRRFPDDAEFKRELRTCNLYRLRGYWLRRMENFGRKERVYVADYTIEHIMPQNENLPAEWRAELGPDWQRVHKEWLHTLGNLTLTGYNPEYSDKPFAVKQTMTGGFKDSPLRLNAGLGTVEKWDEQAIINRANKLADTAATIWTYPEIAGEFLTPATDTQGATTAYTYDDHPFLQNPEPRRLFEALQRQILALDPAVYEEVLKYYIAFKAESNFVDVVPQSQRLRLSLNMKFHDIEDPRGICRDITDVGRWGNGDVEVMFSSLEDLPYIMGLIRQAFEKQMGETIA